MNGNNDNINGNRNGSGNGNGNGSANKGIDSNVDGITDANPAGFDTPARQDERGPLPVKGVPLAIASYHDPGVEMYLGNPCIEALPRILSIADVMDLLINFPAYDERKRMDPAELRLHHIWTVAQVFAVLPNHIDLEQRISRTIRQGYLSRNPLETRYYLDIQERVKRLEGSIRSAVSLSAPPSSFNIIGISGVGKSTALKMVLNLYTQVIVHNQYKEQELNLTQVTWVKLDCPGDGSVRGLCFAFFNEMDRLLGTNYYRAYSRGGRASKDEMLPHIARLVELHAVGVLVIDEVQNLSSAGSDRDHMLNFFVELYNTIGLPVVLVGTYKALHVLKGEFRQARRGSGQGDMVWDRMDEDDVWDEFLESIWTYQYTKKLCALSPELSHCLYEESQGITDFAVKLYMLAQARAITSGREAVTEAVIRSVAKDSLRLARPVLEALKHNNFDKLRFVEDVYIDVGDFMAVEMKKLAQSQIRSHQIQARSNQRTNGAGTGQTSTGDVVHERGQDAAANTEGAPGADAEGRQPGHEEVAQPGSQSQAPLEGATQTTDTENSPQPKTKRGRSKKSGADAKLPNKLKEAASGAGEAANPAANAAQALEDAGYIRGGDEFMGDGAAL